MKRTKLHNKKIGMALRGKKKSYSHKKKISHSATIRLSVPENNPNYKGNQVGYIGIHIWLRKIYGYPKECDACGKKGEKKNNKWTICYAKVKNMKYERIRSNFICLCNKCHRNYDKTKDWNKNISKAKTGVKTKP